MPGKPGVSQPVQGLGALVVGYQPEFPTLDALLLTLLAEAQWVVLVDNGGSQNFLQNAPEARARVHYLAQPGNVGLGAALNAGFAYLAAQQCAYTITFDQDSAPPAGMLATLHEHHRSLQQRGISCAAVGPRFRDRRAGGQPLFPLYQQQGAFIRKVPLQPATTPEHEVDVLITSGMMVNMAAWQAGLHYNPGLFVDYTDTDWCFRARAQGWHLYANLQAEMGHALSDAPPVKFMGLTLLRYSPLRRYYYFRNTLYFLRQNYVSWAWRRRLFAGLLVRLVGNVWMDDATTRSARFILRGLRDGIRGRLGPCPFAGDGKTPVSGQRHS